MAGQGVVLKCCRVGWRHRHRAQAVFGEGIETEREKHTPVKQDTAWEAVVKAMATGWNRDHVSRGITQGWKISQEDFVENYDPSVLPSVTYLLYEIKWNHRRRTWQRWICSAGGEHAETYFLKDVYRKLRSNPFVHCSITCYISWSPCGYCCQEIMDFLEKMPNLNLVIYVARLYWHKEETNREGLWNLENIGVSIQVMDLPDYSYCWTTFVDDEDKYEDEDDYWPRHFSPWIMLYSLELQSILQNIPSCLEISSDENYTPVFSLCVEDEEQKRALTSASPY
ncbi:C-_U-editing enzyme APOBEC-1-like isoform X1 [Mauremys mutica]|uniref:C->U-editing enzyme APOBEC-1-like isoform X1 n=2 Tax=Mauremys mutica TaxID=74926 RepID=UPI001D148F44|nr:C->U-editing enzyme APOBEC-1-like isoform X1 [Mauremys mutica]